MDQKAYLQSRDDYRTRERKVLTRGPILPGNASYYRGSLTSSRTGSPGAEGYVQTTVDRENYRSAKTRKLIREHKTLSRSRFHNDYGSEFFSIQHRISNLKNFDLSTDVSASIKRDSWGFVYPTREAENIAMSLASHGIDSPSSNHALSRANLNWFGTTAMDRTRPSDPAASVAVLVGELKKDGLPSLIGANLKKDGLRGAGGEYLNYQFGISPLVSDIQSFASSVQNADKMLAQWYRDSNRVIRRRYSFPVEEHSEIVTEDEVLPRYGPTHTVHNHHHRGKLTIHRTTKREVWFTGAWLYRIPNFESDIKRRFAEFTQQYDAMPSIGSAWQITPWSWLLDWQLNTRHIARNLSDGRVDRLVLLRGYVMSRTTVTERQILSNGFHTYTANITTVIKQRSKAQPYGIGWKPGMELSPFQLSILAALGISKR